MILGTLPFGRLGPGMHREKNNVIVVKNNYDDAVDLWWSESKVDCVVPMI